MGIRLVFFVEWRIIYLIISRVYDITKKHIRGSDEDRLDSMKMFKTLKVVVNIQ